MVNIDLDIQTDMPYVTSTSADRPLHELAVLNRLAYGIANANRLAQHHA